MESKIDVTISPAAMATVSSASISAQESGIVLMVGRMRTIERPAELFDDGDTDGAGNRDRGGKTLQIGVTGFVPIPEYDADTVEAIALELEPMRILGLAFVRDGIAYRHAPNTNNKTSLWTFMSFGNSMGIGHNRLLFCTLNKAVNSTHRRPSLGRTFALHVIDACGNTKTMDEVFFCGLNDRRSGCYSVGGPLEDRDHPSFLNNNLDLGGFEKQIASTVEDLHEVRRRAGRFLAEVDVNRKKKAELMTKSREHLVLGPREPLEPGSGSQKDDEDAEK